LEEGKATGGVKMIVFVTALTTTGSWRREKQQVELK
jgi:hypothetical protein